MPALTDGHFPLATCSVSRAIVCGLSMGGYVAFSMFRRHRPLVEALILAIEEAGGLS